MNENQELSRNVKRRLNKNRRIKALIKAIKQAKTRKSFLKLNN